MLSELERRYRRLLRIYPPSYRAHRGDEMVATLLETAEPGQTRPSRADRSDLYRGAAREWLGIHAVRGLGPGLRLAGPVMLVVTAGVAVSGFVTGNDWNAGQTGVTGGIVAAGWLLAVLARVFVPRFSLAAVGTAWLVTLAITVLVALTRVPERLDGDAYYRQAVATSWFSIELAAGLVALIAVATATSAPSTIERVLVPVVTAALVAVDVVAVGFGPEYLSWRTHPVWAESLTLLPVAVALVGLAVLARTGSTRWLWAAAALLPLVPYGLFGPYSLFSWHFPPLPTLGAMSEPVASALLLVLALAISRLAVVAAVRGPGEAYHVAGSLSLGLAAAVGSCVVSTAVVHGDTATDPYWSGLDGQARVLLPTVLCALVAIFVPTGLSRALALLGAVSAAVGTFVLPEPNSGVEFSVPGALIVLLVVAAASARTSGGGRRVGAGALASALVFMAVIALLDVGRVSLYPVYFAMFVWVTGTGLAAVALVPMAYWSARRLVLAGSAAGWVGAAVAFLGSFLWVVLLIGPGSDFASVASLVLGPLLVLMAVRVVARRVGARAAAPPESP